MGKCTSKKTTEPHPTVQKIRAPPFEFVHAEDNLHLDYRGPKFRNPTTISRRPQNLPKNPLIAKVSDKKYLVVGGTIEDANHSTFSAHVYIADFIEKKATTMNDCPSFFFQGALYYYNKMAYVVGALDEMKTDEDEEDYEEERKSSTILESSEFFFKDKKYRPFPIHQYDMDLDVWNVIRFDRSMLTANLDIYPDQLYLPGTCIVEHNIYFLCGMKKSREGKLVANEEIFHYDLERKKVSRCLVRIWKYTLLMPSVVPTNHNEFLIVGGYEDQTGNPNKKVLIFTVDRSIDEKEDLDRIYTEKKMELTDLNNFPPFGRDGIAILFKYPEAYMFNEAKRFRDVIDIKTYHANYSEKKAGLNGVF